MAIVVQQYPIPAGVMPVVVLPTGYKPLAVDVVGGVANLRVLIDDTVVTTVNATLNVAPLGDATTGWWLDSYEIGGNSFDVFFAP